MHSKSSDADFQLGATKGDIVDMGELAALTVANESMDMNGASGTNASLQKTLNNEFRRTWNPRYILK